MLDPQVSALLGELGVDPAMVEKVITGGIYLTIVSIIAAIPTGLIAKRKGRSVAGWVIFELCVPLLPLAIIWLLPGRKIK
ncbi:MAG TPA: hypothetical protein VMJ14_15365 [Burkholderiales bacterium]|nr:hypothetical protein [Burkholderiales bacterium]